MHVWIWELTSLYFKILFVYEQINTIFEEEMVEVETSNSWREVKLQEGSWNFCYKQTKWSKLTIISAAFFSFCLLELLLFQQKALFLLAHLTISMPSFPIWDIYDRFHTYTLFSHIKLFQYPACLWVSAKCKWYWFHHFLSSIFLKNRLTCFSLILSVSSLFLLKKDSLVAQ